MNPTILSNHETKIATSSVDLGSPFQKRIPLHMKVNTDNLTICSSVLSPRVISKSIASNRFKMLATAATYVKDIEARTGLFTT